jgi:integrase
METHDRAEAERLGRLFLASLLKGEQAIRSGTLTLQTLWERYSTECSAHLDNAPESLKDARARSALLISYFGEECDVRDLTAQDQAAYSTKRLAGGISYTIKSRKTVTKPVRARSVEQDLKLLHSMLAWATTVRIGRRGRLLDRNPLAGVKRMREQNPRREVATWERFTATRKAIAEWSATADPATATVYTKVDLALVIAEGTGRRLGAIAKLECSDLDLVNEVITWRAQTDKMGKKWVVPMPTGLASIIREYMVKTGIRFGFLFPDPKNPARPMPRYLFGDVLEKAEKHAGLPKLDGALWHAYRRSWASARKHLSLVDVAAAGGWSDTGTLLRCYQHPDQETMLAVVNEPRKVTEKARTG